MSIAAVAKANITVGGTTVEASANLLAQAQHKFDQQIAASQTNSVVPLAFTTADLQGLLIYADQDCTLKTNSNTSPTQTFTVKANKPIFWLVKNRKPCYAYKK